MVRMIRNAARTRRKKCGKRKSLFPFISIIFICSCLVWTASEESPGDDDEHQQQGGDEGKSNNLHEEDNSSITAKNNKRPRITLLGLDDILQLERSGIVGLGSHNVDSTGNQGRERLSYEELQRSDMIEDGIYDPFAPDPSCLGDDQDVDGKNDNVVGVNCWQPPDSTVDTEYVEVWEDVDEDDDEDEQISKDVKEDGSTNTAGLETLAWGYGGDDPDDSLPEDEEEEEEDLDDDNQDCTPNDDSSDEAVVGSDDDEGEGIIDDQESSSTSSSSSSKSGSTTDANAANDTINQSSSKKKKKVKKSKTILVDKHWGADDNILKMRDRLRGSNNNDNNANNNDDANKKNGNQRPPVFLLPGLASTRLVAWKHKPCPQSPLLSDIKMLDHVWLNMNLLIQMATIDARCWSECMTLGRYQSDYHDFNVDTNHMNATATATIDGDDDKQGDEESQKMHHCKLRPDEGLDSISSLAPGSISSNLLVGGTNTVYAWLIQWLADNLGYDVTSIVAMPYDWRLSPDKMESRDGFLTLMRKKIEAAVESNGMPGIMVAHSMGNSVFRYFLEWLRVQLRNEAYERYEQQAEHAIATAAVSSHRREPFWRGRAIYRNIVGGRENNITDEDDISVEFTRAYEPDANVDKADASKGNDLNLEEEDGTSSANSDIKYPKLWELAKIEGDQTWIEWLGEHVWTYVGLAAPLLGAPGPLRSVLSGENMGLPFTDEEARMLELSFGSTSTVNPIPTKMGFCDDPNDRDGSWRAKRGRNKSRQEDNRNLACLDELVSGIEAKANETYNPWKDYPALRLLLKDRVDYDSSLPMISVEREYCDEDEKAPCANQTAVDFSALDVMNGNIFDQFSNIWKEETDPLGVKLEQLSDSWWKGIIPNMLESTPDRPHIKHVIMAYGTDVPTEAAYIYKKTDRKPNPAGNATSSEEEKTTFDGVPEMYKVIWEEKHGRLFEESMPEPSTFTESILFKKKQTRKPLEVDWLHHSGDGTIPYISLMWAHTWLLHATRAMRSANHTMPMLEGERISNPNNALDSIRVSHRPKGGNDWIEGYGADPRVDNYDYSRSNIGDTGTSHPHGTKYKPKMVRFQSEGRSRSTGMEYTTTVIEAIGVEHKETTRNYDILAAAFTNVLQNLNEDYGLV